LLGNETDLLSQPCHIICVPHGMSTDVYSDTTVLQVSKNHVKFNTNSTTIFLP